MSRVGIVPPKKYISEFDLLLFQLHGPRDFLRSFRKQILIKYKEDEFIKDLISHFLPKRQCM